MTRLFVTIGLLGILSLAACTHPGSQRNKAVRPTKTGTVAARGIPDVTENRYHGISLRTTGPRGGGYTNLYGQVASYRLFRVQVFNDTIVPVELEIAFPARPIFLLPDSAVAVQLSVLPDSLTPETIRDTFNFGIVGIERYFGSIGSTPSSLKKTIQPRQTEVLHIGVLFKTIVGNGVTRSKLFFKGQEIDAAFLPDNGPPVQSDTPFLELVYGIGVDPPNYYARVPCGRVVFK